MWALQWLSCALEHVAMHDDEKWRLPAAYRHVGSSSRAGLAWEFLRRNRTFQDAYRRLAGAPTQKSDAPAEQQPEAKPWGLLTFRPD
jgi:hypothetical protein